LRKAFFVPVFGVPRAFQLTGFLSVFAAGLWADDGRGV